jgi:hypothetical protein
MEFNIISPQNNIFIFGFEPFIKWQIIIMLDV